ncbi:hypothetical protein ACFL3B_02665 [Gemmatimonadota bacterium]
MTSLYVAGGRQKPGSTTTVPEWHQYGAGVVLRVQPDNGTIDCCVEYVTPPDRCAFDDDPSILFKSGTLVGESLYVPTQTEVMVFDITSFGRTGYVSLPCFNDVHHVTPGKDGKLLVTNTGLDMVVETTLNGKVCREWSVIGEELWTRFSRATDYRKVVTTKPHRSHPNHVFMVGGEIWVTRCDQGDALCLTREQRPIQLANQQVHDGHVHENRIYFTTVSGQVILVDAVSKQVLRRYDLNSISDRKMPLGWCRGMAVLEDDCIVVGFSRLRRTKWKRNLRWIKHRLGGDGTGLLPTRLEMFDLKRGKRAWEIDLENAGLNAVFSVHAKEGY